MCVSRMAAGRSAPGTAEKRRAFSSSYGATSITSGRAAPSRYWFVPGPVMSPGFGASTTARSRTVATLTTQHAIANVVGRSYTADMRAWRPVSLVGPGGRLRAAGQVAAEVAASTDPVILTGALFGRIAPHARLLCGHLARVGRPWAVETEVAVA